MELTSPAFENEGVIPERFTCKGLNINPPLHLGHIPEGTRSLCIIMHDPDSPSGDFVHWVGYDIAPTEMLAEGSKPGRQGANDFGKIGYGGPCPSEGTHRYLTEAYALDTVLELPDGKRKEEVETAMTGHVLESARLTGRVSAE